MRMSHCFSLLALAAIAAALLFAVPVRQAHAHCQIPCGIYDDHMRFVSMREDITTIEKSMREIETLSASPRENANQLVRWVINKEEHADKLTADILKYFMQQRIAVPEGTTGQGWEEYVAQVTTCHNIVVTAMKAKQTTDQAHVAKLRELVDRFEGLYFDEEELAHLRSEHGHGHTH